MDGWEALECVLPLCMNVRRFLCYVYNEGFAQTFLQNWFHAVSHTPVKQAGITRLWQLKIVKLNWCFNLPVLFGLSETPWPFHKKIKYLSLYLNLKSQFKKYQFQKYISHWKWNWSEIKLNLMASEIYYIWPQM